MKKYELIEIDGHWWTQFLYDRWVIRTDDESFIREFAKEISLLKWDIIIECDGEMLHSITSHPLLSKLKHCCAYCELFKAVRNKCDLICPLNLNDLNNLTCLNLSHPCNLWDGINNTKNAKSVRNLIYRRKYAK